MQLFFSGTVVLLYFLSRYAAEPIFIASCFLPTAYGIAVAFFLRFGGCGKIIMAHKRAKRMARKGVISGEKRALFYKKCVKGAPAPLRAAYVLFEEGKLTKRELALAASRAVNLRSGLLKGGMWCVGVFASLAVFLTFFFASPMEEAVLRATICAFFAAANAVALHFALYATVTAAEKSAERFADVVDRSLLREKREETLVVCPQSDAIEREPFSDKDEQTLFDLRSLLRDLDAEGQKSGAQT